MTSYQCYFHDFFAWLSTSGLAAHQGVIKQAIHRVLQEKVHGDMHRWQSALHALPEIKTDRVILNQSAPAVVTDAPLTNQQKKTLHQSLKGLCPWRKGPFDFFGEKVNAEWRSDWKWDRLASSISPLTGRLVLDVGCGSGYHCWRMLGAGAGRVIGIDPSRLFMLQLQSFKRYAGTHLPIDLLPLRMEELPQRTAAFDTVFSMGVLYHRKSPLEHLESLFHTLRPGGELVLETLVVKGDSATVLMPENRYAMMPNVWFLCSVEHLFIWLQRAGFKDTQLISLNQTSIREQRSTPWMPYQSLEDYLDPDDHTKTIEGYPAPLRVIITARRPF